MSDNSKILDFMERAKEPVAPDLSERDQKLRKNLIGISFISIFLLYKEISFSSATNPLFGIKFENLKQQDIFLLFFIINIYLLFSYLLKIIEHIKKTKILKTGYFMRPPSEMYAGNNNNPESDLGAKEDQASLYFWWTRHQNQIDKLQKAIENIETGGNDLLASKIYEIKLDMEKSLEIKNSPRIEISLKRFDACFWSFKNLQNCRFLILDLILPFSLGITSAVWLSNRVFCVI